MTRDLILLGSGGHGKVLLDALLLSGARPLGILDVDPTRHGQQVFGVPVLGDESWLQGREASVELVNGLGSVRTTAARKALFEQLKHAGYRFGSVRHPASIISPFARLGEGVQVLAGAIVQADAEVNANVIINTGACVEHDCRIDAHVHLAPGVTLSGSVRIGEGTHVGTGATVVQGVTIGKHCVIAAGAVVVRDVPDGVTVKGVPGRWDRH